MNQDHRDHKDLGADLATRENKDQVVIVVNRDWQDHWDPLDHPVNRDRAVNGGCRDHRDRAVITDNQVCEYECECVTHLE